MILLEVIDAERRKLVAALSPATDDGPGPSRRHPQPVELPPPGPPSSRPPDYATSQAEAEEAEKLKAEDIIKAANRSQRRLRRFLVYALVVYLVLSISVGVPLFLVLRKDAQQAAIDMSEKWMSGANLPPPPPPPDWLPPDVSNLLAEPGSPLQCDNWTHVPATESQDSYYWSQYSLPLTTTLYVQSNFSQPAGDREIYSGVSGTLRVSVVNDTSQRNATVSVMMRDIGVDALKRASVCLMGSQNISGLSINVPHDAEDMYYYDVHLQLPLRQRKNRLCSLVTYLPSFNQTFDSLDSYMDLESLDVEGSLGSIYFESVHAESILVKASAASIAGTFNATDKLILETVLQPITANVSLYNQGYDYDPSELTVETGNSSITLNVNLRSQNDDEFCTPMYVSSLKSFNGPIDVAYYHDSSVSTSTLFIRAVTSNEPARIFVDRVYQGAYDVRTTLADAIVNRSTTVTDPTGQDRNRTFQDSYVSSDRIYGWAGWGPRDDRPPRSPRQGNIQVASSLSPAILELTEYPDPDLLLISNGSTAVAIPEL